MDYARLALIKAEQAEENTGGVSPLVTRAGLSFDQEIAANKEFKICDIVAEGEASKSAGIILALNFSVFLGTLELRVGGKTVFSKTITESMVITASADLSGTESISIVTSYKARLTSAEVMLIGGRILTTAMGEVKVAELEGRTAAAMVSGGEVRVFISDSLPDFGSYVVAGFGKNPSLAALELAGGSSCFAVCFGDDAGNVFLTLLDKNGVILSSTTLGISAAAVALTSHMGQLIIGYVKSGYAYAAVLTPPDFLPDFVLKLEEAAGIQFVRKSLPPAVILDKKNSFVIRLARDEVAAEDAVSIKIICEAGT